MPPEPSATLSESTSSTSTTPTVLLAEDDDDLRETLRRWLEADAGWEVREADNGRVALEKLDAEIDILTLDRQMPGYSGAEIFTQLENSTVECAVVVVSCLEPNERLNEQMVEAYIVKPATREQFLQTLRACL